MGQFGAHDKLRIPLPAEPLDACGMGGRARRRQFIEGSPTFGDLAEPGVFLVRLLTKRPTEREGLLEEATSRVEFEREKSGTGTQLGGEAVAQVGEGRLDSPFAYRGSGKLPVNGEGAVVSPACRFGAQRADTKSCGRSQNKFNQ